MGEVGLGCWKGFVEVCNRLPLPSIKPSLDLNYQNVPTPTVFDSRLSVPEALVSILDKIQEPNIMAPRQLCNRLLHKVVFWPSFR